MPAKTVCGSVVALMLGAQVAVAGVLNVGDEFPVWQLVAHTGADVTSAAFLGRSYVVWFYPAAMTPGCTAEGRGFKEHYSAFQNVGVDIVGVSFDSPDANAAFAAAEDFSFTLLSDTNRSLALAVGAADSPTQLQPRRISYLVGEDGRVVRVYSEVQPTRHAQDILLDLGVAAP
jgi:peroxiredoxin Q/BCP